MTEEIYVLLLSAFTRPPHPYHFAIDSKGNIYEGRPLDIIGSHVKGSNTGKIGIVLLADLDEENRGMLETDKGLTKTMTSATHLAAEIATGNGKMTDEMLQSLLGLSQYLADRYGIEYYGGHQEVIEARYCPGNIGMEWVERIRQVLHLKKFPTPKPTVK